MRGKGNKSKKKKKKKSQKGGKMKIRGWAREEEQVEDGRHEEKDKGVKEREAQYETWV